MRSLIASAVAVAAFAATPAVSAPFAVDRSHANIGFSVSHFGYSDTYGRFGEYEAEIDFDPEAPENSTVRIVIQADSVDTNWDPRDEHLRGADFFDVENFPTIEFVSTSIEMTGDNTAKLTGDLTLLGVTNSETFDVTLNKIAPSPISQKLVVGFDATAVIDRTDYGLDKYAPNIAAEIPVMISLEMSPAD